MPKEETYKAEAYRRLEEISRLKSGWDGEDAPAVSEAAVNHARAVLTGIRHSPDVYPTGRGTLQFQFEKPDGSYLELEFFPDHVGVLLVIQKDFEKSVSEDVSEWDTKRVLACVSVFFDDSNTLDGGRSLSIEEKIVCDDAMRCSIAEKPSLREAAFGYIRRHAADFSEHDLDGMLDWVEDWLNEHYRPAMDESRVEVLAWHDELESFLSDA